MGVSGLQGVGKATHTIAYDSKHVRAALWSVSARETHVGETALLLFARLALALLACTSGRVAFLLGARGAHIERALPIPHLGSRVCGYVHLVARGLGFRARRDALAARGC